MATRGIDEEIEGEDLYIIYIPSFIYSIGKQEAITWDVCHL